MAPHEDPYYTSRGLVPKVAFPAGYRIRMCGRVGRSLFHNPMEETTLLNYIQCKKILDAYRSTSCPCGSKSHNQLYCIRKPMCWKCAGPHGAWACMELSLTKATAEEMDVVMYHDELDKRYGLLPEPAPQPEPKLQSNFGENERSYRRETVDPIPASRKRRLSIHSDDEIDVGNPPPRKISRPINVPAHEDTEVRKKKMDPVHKKKLDHVDNKVNQVDKKVDQVDNKVDQVAEQVKQMAIKMDRLTSEIRQLNKDVDLVDLEAEKHEEELNRYGRHIATLNNKITNDINPDIKKLQKEIEKERAAREDLSKKVRNLNGRAAEFKSDILRLFHQKHVLETQITEVGETVKRHELRLKMVHDVIEDTIKALQGRRPQGPTTE